MPYFRDQVVAELTSLYELLFRMYLPSNALKLPPSGGWPNINSERFAFTKNAKSVIDLMKRLPCIRQDEEFDPYQVHSRAVCNDYSGKFFESDAVAFRHMTLWDPIGMPEPSSHLLTLWYPEAPNQGQTVFIDTQTGALNAKFMTAANYDTYPNIQAFCESAKNDFLTLECIPLRPDRVASASTDDTLQGVFPAVKKTYHDHGWPSSNFQKDSCVTTVAQITEEEERRIYGP